MNRFIICLLLSTIATTGFQSDDKIKTDGILTSTELKGTQEYELGTDNKIFIKTIRNILYIAITGDKRFWAHVYLSDNKLVKVMHASAAIDAVEYNRNGTSWTTRDSFQYELRDKDYNNEVESIMAKYLSNNGWVANNVNLGNGKTVEFKIDINKWKGPLYLSCVIANNDMSFYPFPSTLNDDTLLPRLVQGYTPDSLSFEPIKWTKIKSE